MQTLVDTRRVLQPLLPEPVACARCGHDDLDDDHYCPLCGAVTIQPDRFVTAADPER